MVEDEATILKLSAKSLRKQGYTVITAENPSDALKIAKEHGETIHLLITDVVMPEMNGWDLSRLYC
jgi:DNA-binding response OmpR family regulator